MNLFASSDLPVGFPAWAAEFWHGYPFAVGVKKLGIITFPDTQKLCATFELLASVTM